jgi:hypothetical protein
VDEVALRYNAVVDQYVSLFGSVDSVHPDDRALLKWRTNSRCPRGKSVVKPRETNVKPMWSQREVSVEQRRDNRSH